MLSIGLSLVTNIIYFDAQIAPDVVSESPSYGDFYVYFTCLSSSLSTLFLVQIRCLREIHEVLFLELAVSPGNHGSYQWQMNFKTRI